MKSSCKRENDGTYVVTLKFEKLTKQIQKKLHVEIDKCIKWFREYEDVKELAEEILGDKLENILKEK